MGRTADDIVLFLEATSGNSPATPLSQHHRFTRDKPRSLRLAYCADVAHVGIEDDIEGAGRHAAFTKAQAQEITIDILGRLKDIQHPAWHNARQPPGATG